MSERPFRVLPKVTPATEHFWRGGAEGELRFLRCDDCWAWIHPPAPTCPACLSRDLSVAASSGAGTVVSYTVNHKPWNPTMPDRYVVAFVETDEGVRLLTNVVDGDPDDVHIGQQVEVRFEQHGAVWIPLFAPVEGDEAPRAAAVGARPPPWQGGARDEAATSPTAEVGNDAETAG